MFIIVYCWFDNKKRAYKTLNWRLFNFSNRVQAI